MTRTAADMNLIWKHTHSDYRGTHEGERSILICRIGATTIVPMAHMTDTEFADQLASAKRAEARKRAT